MMGEYLSKPMQQRICLFMARTAGVVWEKV
jgi:hypothetical protein